MIFFICYLWINIKISIRKIQKKLNHSFSTIGRTQTFVSPKPSSITIHFIQDVKWYWPTAAGCHTGRISGSSPRCYYQGWAKHEYAPVRNKYRYYYRTLVRYDATLYFQFLKLEPFNEKERSDQELTKVIEDDISVLMRDAPPNASAAYIFPVIDQSE